MLASSYGATCEQCIGKLMAAKWQASAKGFGRIFVNNHMRARIDLKKQL
jgi:hypothetical protein